MRLIVIAVILFAGLAFAQSPSETTLTSPGGKSQIVFTVAGNGQLTYRVNFNGKPVFTSSALGLDIVGQAPLGPKVKLAGSQTGAIDETYTMPHGKASNIRNHAATLELAFEEPAAPGRKFTIQARAYDDGVAFRYVLPEQAAIPQPKLSGERTEFTFAKESTAHFMIQRNFRTSHEDTYYSGPLTSIHPSWLLATPFLAELPGTAWVAITDAELDNYPGMYLSRSRDNRALMPRLSPSIDDEKVAVVGGPGPIRSAWRTILLGDQPGRLIESNVITNLNPPSAIADTSWIKPGKTAWDWWSGSWAEGVDFKPGMNTATMRHYIDFAAASGLEYMLIDAGWATRLVPGADSVPGTDLTKPNPNVDVPALVAYGKSKGVGVWLWGHWADVEKYGDQFMPLCRQWGVVGIKVDYMDRDDQWMVNYYRRIVKKAAENHLMVDFHGAFKPDGVERTWPNLMTREGVMGAEYTKWSGRVTPDHNVMLAFTRMLAGPLDYTPGGFDNVTREEFNPRFQKPVVMYTRAHTLALYAIYESGLQMVSDYPEAYKDQKDFEFIKAAPANWDETRVLSGRPGEHVSIARRHGREWFVGSITGFRGADVDVPLSFLGPGQFVAEIYSDAPDANQNAKKTVISQERVTSSTVIHAKLANGGGQAIRIRPAQ